MKNTIKIIALYGQLAHEKTARCLDGKYPLSHYERALADIVTLELPEDVELGENAAGTTILGVGEYRYTVGECITQDVDGDFWINIYGYGKHKLTVVEVKNA